MPVVGTAGHVDHGKSTLVEGLTGRDPDRWEEEKRRGLTIDLGFAWMDLPDGTEVSFVDVPGHERFIKNMLAGTETIDVALLVVAADEGWMPQSEEHLAVLDLLGVQYAVVAVTKIDRVDAETIELAILEVEDRLEGTALEGSPIVPVAAPTRHGYDRLLTALTEAVVAATGGTADQGRPRLWIDRAFSITGAGTVVTGTLTGGTIRVDDRLELWPGSVEVRVRGLQSHEAARSEAHPTCRVAVNLAGIERRHVRRGDMLGGPGQWSPSDTLLVDLQTARYVDEPLTHRGAYHLHLGAGAWPVSLRLVESEELHGTGAALLRLPGALPVAAGDRFILREVGRRAVVGGGRVLDPAPDPRRGALLESLPNLRSVLDRGPDAVATALLEIRQHDQPARLSAHSGGGVAAGFSVSAAVFSPGERDRLHGAIVDVLREFHDANPLRPGMPAASLAGRVGVDRAFIEALAATSDRIRDDGATVALGSFQSGLSGDQEAAWGRLREGFRAAGLVVPRLKELDVDPDLLHALLREGRLIRVSDEIAYLPEQLEQLEADLDLLEQPFTVSEFRDRFDISRKYAVPLLEWLDARGVTERDGDVRTVRRAG
jgi:selenocysteine-specific elongation factor